LWYSKSHEDALNELQTNAALGLSDSEVSERQEKYGPNRLEGKKKKSLISLFFGQLQDALIYVLLAAAAVTVLVHEYADAIIILAVVVLNAVIGVVQEAKAEKAIEALKKLTTPRSIVRRNGKEVEVNSTELVPGDIVLLDCWKIRTCTT